MNKKSILAAALAAALAVPAVHASIHAQLAGRFKFEAFKPDANGVEIPGTRRVAADWFDNLITDNGLDLLGAGGNYNSTILVACRVGTGSTAPATTDTGLVSHLAATTTEQANSTGVQGTAPYFGWRRKTWRFALGAVVGNVAEVGIFNALTGGTMFSRALIEAAGVPTTITILADEQLDVVYELRNYAQVGDTAWGPVTISGVDYSGVVRAAFVTDATTTGSWFPGVSGLGYTGLIMGLGTSMVGAFVYATQTLGPITGQPAGTRYENFSRAASAYVSGTYYRDHTLVWDLNEGNAPGGVGSFRTNTSFGAYQLSITPLIPKDATKRLTLYVRISFGRYTP